MAFHHFDVGFTLAGAEADCAALLHQFATHVEDARAHVANGGEFDLEFGLGGLGVFGEDFENQVDAIPGFDFLILERFVEVIDLARLEKVIDDEDVGVVLLGEGGDFFNFAFADVGFVVGERFFLDNRNGRKSAVGAHEALELFEAFFGFFFEVLGSMTSMRMARMFF